MFTVGLTGGIGSGKSTFAVLLAERGAQVIDADQLGRDALRPGRPAWHSVVDTFGDEILVEGTMDIDRKALAALVFADRNKLAVLNAITHPLIAEGIANALERLSHSDEIVVLDAALIVEMGLDRIVNALVVVDAPDEIRKTRLVRSRGMTLEDVEARITAQALRSELLDRADIVVHNGGSMEDLAREADRVWAELKERAG